MMVMFSSPKHLQNLDNWLIWELFQFIYYGNLVAGLSDFLNLKSMFTF